MNMDLNKLRDEAFETAKAHGWHDEELPDETCLMLIITEASEAVQADRKGRHAEVGKFLTFKAKGDCPWENDFEAFVKNSVEDELSDIIIRCLDLAGLRGIGFDFANDLLQAETDSITSPFPYYMYCVCSILTSPKGNLDFKLNYCVYAIVCYCRQRGIDIEFFIKQKMQYNKLRPFRHGNKKY